MKKTTDRRRHTHKEFYAQTATSTRIRVIVWVCLSIAHNDETFSISRIPKLCANWRRVHFAVFHFGDISFLFLHLISNVCVIRILNIEEICYERIEKKKRLKLYHKKVNANKQTHKIANNFAHCSATNKNMLFLFYNFQEEKKISESSKPKKSTLNR